jgi:hypothetical protein
MNQAEAEQARKVNAAYATTRSVNPEYEREFEILSEMRRANMADQFRSARGLPPNGKTPYDS